MSQSLPDHRPFPPPAPSPRPPKHGWDVKLPEISCDNKQLLSFEISLYSWTTLIFFSHSPARRQSQAGSGLDPYSPPPQPTRLPCHQCCFDVQFLRGTLWLNCFFFSYERWTPSFSEGKPPTVLMTAVYLVERGGNIERNIASANSVCIIKYLWATHSV